MRIGGIILCGGQSSRMGSPKVMLPFGEERMLQRVARILSEAVSPIVIVAAEGQELPECGRSVIIVRDERPDHGPLEGLRVGLSAIAPLADAAYVTSVDVPLLSPAFVRQVIAKLEDSDIAVPCEMVDGKAFHHPLAGVYHTRVLPVIERQLAANRLRLSELFDICQCQRVPVEELRTADPQLRSLRNINTPADYAAALQLAGIAPAR